MSLDLPTGFNHPGARFVLLSPGKKKPPLSKEWQLSNISYTQACEHNGNVGIIAHPPYVIIDIDEPAAWEGLPLPATMSWETRPGRRALMYRYAEDLAPILTKYGKGEDHGKLMVFDPGNGTQQVGQISLRNTYQIIPPSYKHLQGGKRADYKMIDERVPALLNLSALLAAIESKKLTFSKATPTPQERNERLTRPTKEARDRRSNTVQNARNFLNAALARAKDGNRNETGLWLACQLRDLKPPPTNPMAYMVEYARKVPQPPDNATQPYTKNEALESLRQAFTRSPRGPPLSVEARNVGKDIEEPAIEPDVDEEDRGRATTLYPSFIDCYRWAIHKGKWMIWAGNVWIEAEDSRVGDVAGSILEHIYLDKLVLAKKGEAMRWEREITKSRRRNAIENALWFLSGKDGIETRPDQWDANGWELNTAKSIIDLKTGQDRVRTPQDLVTKLAPVEYDPNAEGGLWSAHIEKVLPNAHIRRQVQRDLGRALVGGALTEELSIWYGQGANGRSTTIRAIQTVLGMYAQRAAPNLLMQTRHERHPTELADLQGARVVFSVEIDEGKKLAEAVAKELTGGDRVKARYMRQDFFEFQQTWSIFLVVNHKPVITGQDRAIWRRIRLVPWEATIPDNEQRPQDEMVEELTREGSAILNWLLKGLNDWQTDKKWIAPEVITATRDYQQEQDLLAGFLADRCELGKHYQERFAALYTAYKVWCAAEGEKPTSKRQFSSMLDQRGITSTKEGKRHIFMKSGIKLSDRSELEPRERGLGR